MAFDTADRVKESSTTTGTGTFTLAGAQTGYQAFSAICANGDTVYYCIADQGGANWEVGTGTWNTGGTLTRTAPNVIAGSAGVGTLVNFTGGTKDVFLTVPASVVLQVRSDGVVALPPFGTGVPSVPSSGTFLFNRSIANRQILAQSGPSGLDFAFQPILARNKVGYWNPPGNATTVPGVFGLTAIGASGTATARTVVTTNLATRMRRIGYPSATTAGSFAGGRIAVTQFTCGSGSSDGSGFTMIERWVESTPAPVSGQRAFAGMSSNSSAPTNVEANTLTNSIGLGQLSTDATQWYWIQGGSAAQTAVAVGTGVGAPGGNSTTAWELAIFCPVSPANTFYLQLTNLTTGVVATTTMSGTSAQVPQSTTLLAWRHWACNNATALAVGVDICSLYIETDT